MSRIRRPTGLDMPLENADDDDAASLEKRVQRVIEEDWSLFDALDE